MGCASAISVGIRAIFKLHVTDIVVSTADSYNIWHLFVLHTCGFNCTPIVSQEHLYLMYRCVSKYGHLCLDISSWLVEVCGGVMKLQCVFV